MSDSWEEGAASLRRKHLELNLAEAKYDGTTLAVVHNGHLPKVQESLDGADPISQAPEGKRLADCVRKLMEKRHVAGDDSGALKLTQVGWAVLMAAGSLG